MQQSVKVKRLRGLDALRGLAALSVVLFHYTTAYEIHFGPYPSRPFFFVPNGHFGVELFFCISGFVILGTIERTAGLQRFAIARFARIYPAYVVCALISLSTLYLAHFNRPPWTPESILLHATMLTGLVGADSIDPSYWTLSYEVIFYAGAATVWSLLGGVRRLELPCLLWLACSYIGHVVAWVPRHHRLMVLLGVPYANLFVVGMMLYYLHKGSRTVLARPTLCAALLMSLFPPEFNGGHMPQPAYMAMILAFAAAIWFVAKSDGRFLDIRPLVFLGEISYSLYLIHQMVGLALIRVFLRLGLPTDAAIFAAIAFVICLAFGLRVGVEKPAEQWIKSFGKKSLKGVDGPPRGAPTYSLART